MAVSGSASVNASSFADAVWFTSSGVGGTVNGIPDTVISVDPNQSASANRCR